MPSLDLHLNLGKKIEVGIHKSAIHEGSIFHMTLNRGLSQ